MPDLTNEPASSRSAAQSSIPPAAAVSHDWINLLGVRLSAVNLSSAVASIISAVTAGRKGYICVRDVHGLVRCQNDLLLKQIHNEAFLLTPDGMPLVWALKLSGHKEAGRVYGPDLMLALFELGQRNGLRHFLYGTTPEVLQRLQFNLLEKFPSAKIVGSYSPPFRDLEAHEEREIADLVNASRADIVWVGLSTPKQEFWMARMRESLSAGMLIGVGAAFDFHAGVKRQAPWFIQRSGLEWVFRLACEPHRLWRRYAVAVPSFIGLAVAQICNLKDFTIEPEAPQYKSNSTYRNGRPSD